MAMLETGPSRAHYQPDTQDDRRRAEFTDCWRATRALTVAEPRFQPTRSTLPPIEIWILNSHQAESSLLAEAEFEVGISDAGLRTRNVTLQIVDHVAASSSTSLTADEIDLLVDDAWH